MIHPKEGFGGAGEAYIASHQPLLQDECLPSAQILMVNDRYCLQAIINPPELIGQIGYITHTPPTREI
jgi:hypothetical protein